MLLAIKCVVICLSMLSVIMLSVVLLNVVAPYFGPSALVSRDNAIKIFSAVKI